MDSLPSLNLWSQSHRVIDASMASLGNSSYFSSLSVLANQDRKSKWQDPDSNSHRFSPEQVRDVEDALEAELMPFSIQDLRTNEVIAFHAFLGSLTDSYAAEWSGQKGFGRLEAAQIYGGASRSIGLDFTLISFNETDFNEMWYKINKLTTLVYPQWSEGTIMDAADGSGSFIQPFSQVPTASPLARVRVGDIFTSNYSKQNVARLFGVGNPNATKFALTSSPTKEESEKDPQPRILNQAGKRKLIKFLLDRNEYEKAMDVKNEDSITIKWGDGILTTTPTDSYLEAEIGTNSIRFGFGSDKNDFYSVSKKNYTPSANNIQIPKLDANGVPIKTKDEKTKDEKAVMKDVDGIEHFFKSENNPIIRAFESTAGRGIACAITSIGFDWGWGENSWNTDPGSRAPRTCKVSLGLTPIHDITPGLDHNGINRAPIYGVGSYMSNQKGDPHYSTNEYNNELIKSYHDAETSLHPSTKEIKWKSAKSDGEE